MAAKINRGKDHTLNETGLFLKLVADELLLMLNTKTASQKNSKGRHSKKIFLQDQHIELKEMIDEIIEYVMVHKRKMIDTGDVIKTLLSEHENMISYYREKSSRSAGELSKEGSHFIKSLLEKHGKMAWALRAQLK